MRVVAQLPAALELPVAEVEGLATELLEGATTMEVVAGID